MSFKNWAFSLLIVLLCLACFLQGYRLQNVEKRSDGPLKLAALIIWEQVVRVKGKDLSVCVIL